MKLRTLLTSTIAAAGLASCGGQGGEAPAGGEAGGAGAASERSEIRIVGSSTVYPFSTKVAQEFKNMTGVNVVVESTGSGGGHKLFCEGAGSDTPDITNSSRRQKASELDACGANGVGDVVEVLIGYDGIVMGSTREAVDIDLTLRQVFQAFAKELPTSDDDCTPMANPNQKWSDIDPSLPDTTIEVYGPPPTSGTRDAFVEIAMEGGAQSYACLAALADSDSNAFQAASHTLREDGNWIDSGENDNVIVQTLVNTPTAYGVFGYSFLDQNTDKIKAARIDGAEPTFENISSAAYPVSRSLYFYIKAAHMEIMPSIRDYALEFLSDSAAGEGGYLEEIGLVPLADADRAAYREAVMNGTGYSHED